MPVYLRMWYINKLAETRRKENEAVEKRSKKSPAIHQPTFDKRR